MSARTMQNPGVELNEIDRSAYGRVDNSLPNSPTSLMVGFADKGEDMTLEWINSKAVLDDTFGTPTTEFESYLYNAAMEVLNRGGTCLASRIPYENKQFQNFNYVDLSVSYFEPQINSYDINSIYQILYNNDNNLTSCIKISSYKNSSNGYGGTNTINALDELITSKKGLNTQNTIRIYDITRAKYDKIDNCKCISSDALNEWTNECIGIVPVVATAANALFFQNMLSIAIHSNPSNTYVLDFNSVSSFATIYHSGIVQQLDDTSSYMSLPLFSTALSNNNSNVIDASSAIDVDSLSRRAAKQFPAINYYGNNHFDNTHLKDICIAVFKAFKDTGNSGKLSFQLLESFSGSLDKNAKDPITKANRFIDNVVNQNSQFIRLFSNVNQQIVSKASYLTTSQQAAVSMGFYKEDCRKNISYQKIIQSLNIILDKASNPNLVPLDIIVDAGMSNIAQLAKKHGLLSTDTQPFVKDYNDWSLGIVDDTIAWKAILQRFNSFCTLRKDCMFIADGLRPMCLEGDAKIVRPTCPQNTIANTIVPKFRLMANAIDSSYAAGYCNWYLQQDYSNGENYFWIPPSIKAMGVYIYCDTYFHPWSAPAGHTRGLLADAVDVAFTPDDNTAGIIYSNAWNYAMNYPIDGVVIEGHKTFQSQRTALDRINVRRLMLDLEKKVARIARAFVYEGNTPYLRQRFVDTIRPVLEDAVSGDGLVEYAIKCDEELNTTQVIENNELRCKIAVKPRKVVDWIVVSFICTNQSANVVEEVLR